MKVVWLLFAVARERAGLSEVEIELPPGSRVTDAARELARRCPMLDDVIPRARIALDDQFTDLDRSLSDGDRLALIPPVSGG
jgi:molybdopterin converting factor small subunit